MMLVNNDFVGIEDRGTIQEADRGSQTGSVLVANKFANQNYFNYDMIASRSHNCNIADFWIFFKFENSK